MKRNKSWLIVIGSFLILSGIGLIGYDYYSNKVIDNLEDLAIEEFYQEEEIEESVDEIKEEPKEEKKE